MKALLLLGIIALQMAGWNADAAGCSAASSDPVGAVGEQGVRSSGYGWRDVGYAVVCFSGDVEGFHGHAWRRQQSLRLVESDGHADDLQRRYVVRIGKINGHAVMTIDSPESFHYKMSVEMVEGLGACFALRYQLPTASSLVRDCFGLKPGEEIDVWE